MTTGIMNERPGLFEASQRPNVIASPPNKAVWLEIVCFNDLCAPDRFCNGQTCISELLEIIAVYMYTSTSVMNLCWRDIRIRGRILRCGAKRFSSKCHAR